jgi:hypothetical protein
LEAGTGILCELPPESSLSGELLPPRRRRLLDHDNESLARGHGDEHVEDSSQSSRPTADRPRGGAGPQSLPSLPSVRSLSAPPPARGCRIRLRPLRRRQPPSQTSVGSASGKRRQAAALPRADASIWPRDLPYSRREAPASRCPPASSRLLLSSRREAPASRCPPASSRLLFSTPGTPMAGRRAKEATLLLAENPLDFALRKGYPPRQRAPTSVHRPRGAPWPLPWT